MGATSFFALLRGGSPPPSTPPFSSPALLARAPLHTHARAQHPLMQPCSTLRAAAGPALPVRHAGSCSRRPRAAAAAAGPRAALAEPPATPFAKDASHLSAWAPDSWRSRTAHQQPNWRDAGELKEATAEIARMPPLVFAGECRTLQARLAACATGEAFMLQGESVLEAQERERERGGGCAAARAAA